MCHFLARFALLVTMLLALPAEAEWIQAEEAIMGTAVRVELWHDDRAAGQTAADAVMREMHRIDRLMSPFKPDSELSHINREAARHPVTISRELFDLIQRSLELSKLTEGAFDITFSSVGYLYDYRRHIKPSERELAQALPGVDYRHVALDRNKGTIQFARPGVRIDLGGIAKGYAVDRGIDSLRQRGIAHALVSAGGDSRILGDRRGRPWMIAVRDPRIRTGAIAVLPLSDAAVSTSGDYERYFEADGVRYHHIINPKTGRSASDVRSVTIVGPDATTTDGLSTSVFVMGHVRGMALVESLPDIEAIVIDAQGQLHYSSGLQRSRSAPRP